MNNAEWYEYDAYEISQTSNSWIISTLIIFIYFQSWFQEEKRIKLT